MTSSNLFKYFIKEKNAEDNSNNESLKLKHESIQKDQILIDLETKIESLNMQISNQKEEVKYYLTIKLV